MVLAVTYFPFRAGGYEKIEAFSHVTTFRKQILFPVVFKQEEAAVNQVLSTTDSSHHT